MYFLFFSEGISVTVLRVIGSSGLVRNVRNESEEERISFQNFSQDQSFKVVIEKKCSRLEAASGKGRSLICLISCCIPMSGVR